MKSESITVQSVKSLMGLAKRKDKLVRDLERIEGRIAALLGGGAAASPKTVKAPKKQAAAKARRGKRSNAGQKILAALEAAGSKGVKVVELAKELGLKNANVHVWFSTTGKKHARRIGRGHYRIKKG